MYDVMRVCCLRPALCSRVRRTCCGALCSVPHRAPPPAAADLDEPLLVAEQAVSTSNLTVSLSHSCDWA